MQAIRLFVVTAVNLAVVLLITASAGAAALPGENAQAVLKTYCYRCHGQDGRVAVSVASMEKIAAGQKPSPDVHPVRCDHLSDFRDPAGLKVPVDTLSAP